MLKARYKEVLWKAPGTICYRAELVDEKGGVVNTISIIECIRNGERSTYFTAEDDCTLEDWTNSDYPTEPVDGAFEIEE